MVNVDDECLVTAHVARMYRFCLVFSIFRLRTMTKGAWKISKLDWKTPVFFLPKEWEPCVDCRLLGSS